VVRVRPLLPDVVSLSEHPDSAHPDSGVIGVDDLAVTADADQMYLVQHSTGRRPEPANRMARHPRHEVCVQAAALIEPQPAAHLAT
jgi:hypothetical protein